MAFEYANPFSAFSSGLQEALVKAEAQRRQELLDQLQFDREERLKAHDAAQLDATKAQTASLNEARRSAADARAVAAANTIKGALTPGMIVDNTGDTADALRAGHMGELLKADENGPKTLESRRVAAPMVGIGATPEAQAAAPVMDAQQHDAMATQATFLGDAKQQEDVAKRKVWQALVDDPNTPADVKLWATGELGGKTVPSELIKPEKAVRQFWQERDGTMRIIGPDGRPQVLPPDFKGFQPGDVINHEPAPPSNGSSSEPTWGTVTGEDGTVYRYNTKDPNAPLIPMKMGAENGGGDFHATTAQTRAMIEGAKMLTPHIHDVDNLAAQLNKAGLFGPVMSRLRDIMVKVGTVDPMGADADVKLQMLGSAIASDPALNQNELAGRFASELSLLASGAGRVHGGARGGGSIQMIDYLKQMLSATSNYEMFHGRLSGLQSYMNTYARGPHAQPTPGKTPAVVTPTTPAATPKRTRYDMNGQIIP